MPPRIKITKADILKKAFALVREKGDTGLNARDLAAALSCSTQPIFSNYPTMSALMTDVIAEGYKLYSEYIKAEQEKNIYPPYKASGMAYIRFAKEEKALFRLLFMRNRSEEGEDKIGDAFFTEMSKKTGMSEDEARLFHLEMWICVHGIAVMIATGYQDLEMSLVSEILTDNYQGLKHRFLEKRNG